MKLPPSNIVTVRYISQGQCWGFLCICICSMQTTAKESLKYKILQGWLIDSFKGYDIETWKSFEIFSKRLEIENKALNL